VALCRRCHRERGAFDRAAGVESAETASVWLLVRRRSAWAGWLANYDRPITLEAAHLRDLARVLGDVARTVSICSLVLVGVAAALASQGISDLAAVTLGVALLLGSRPE
jgi:hypothetical protein